MRLIDDRTGLERLEREDCLRLLASQNVGRVAVVSVGQPLIFPVNYALDGDTVVFRTAAGTKFDAAVRGAPASFEIDSFDALYHTGWSVVLSGRAEEVVRPDHIARLEDIGLRAWASGEMSNWVAITPDQVSGRRVVDVERTRELLDDTEPT